MSPKIKTSSIVSCNSKELESSPEVNESDFQQNSASDSNDSKNHVTSSKAGTLHSHEQKNCKGHDANGRNWDGDWPKTPGRIFGVFFIRAYQLTLSSWIGNSCRHQPTCSEYGYEAIARHGLMRGGWLTTIRIAKCNPFGTSGHDPVPKE